MTLTQSECAFDGAVDPLSINLTTSYNKLSVAYYSSISFYDNTLVIQDFNYTNINSWIWPRPSIVVKEWDFNLPEYVMSSTYSISIGTNINNTLPIFKPFEQCQNAPFITYVVDSSSNTVPSFIIINNIDQTVVFNLTSITSVQTIKLVFWARLVSFYFDQSDLTRIQTANSPWFIEFTNSNWKIKSINIGSYLVVNKLQNYTVEFIDPEGDKISFKFTYNNLVNIFIQQTPNILSQYNVIMQTETVSKTPVVLEFSYTDTYHKDNQYLTLFNATVNLFASEPPIFDSNLTKISISRWSNFEYLLPHITDPDGQGFTVHLSNSTPNWIALIDNSTIRVTPIKQPTSQSETVSVEIVLTDDTNAFSKYILNVTLLPYQCPQYENIVSISSSDLIDGVALNITSPNPVNAVDWSSDSILSWLYFNTSSSMLMLKDKMPVNTTWCKLWSTDLCGTSKCSNEFDVTQQPIAHKPPVVTNTFGPLTIYVNIEYEFEVPSDLFYSSDNSLAYSISTPSWNKHYPLKTNLSKYKQTKQYYLYLSSHFVQIWYLDLFATDKNNQTASVSVQVNVNACATKDCLKWVGIYQSNWTECQYNYKLNGEGQCLQISPYYIKNNNDFYSIWGIITMTVLLISVLMSLLFGRKYLHNLAYAQSFLVFIFWSNNIDDNLQAFASWLQWSKMEFGYLHYSQINAIFDCVLESTKMTNLQFGCQSTVLNYFWVLVFFILAVSIYKLLDKIKNKFELISLLINFINWVFPSSLMMWIFIHLYYKFVLINIIALDFEMMK